MTHNNADHRLVSELRAVAAYHEADCYNLDYALSTAQQRHGYIPTQERKTSSWSGFFSKFLGRGQVAHPA